MHNKSPLLVLFLSQKHRFPYLSAISLSLSLSLWKRFYSVSSPSPQPIPPLSLPFSLRPLLSLPLNFRVSVGRAVNWGLCNDSEIPEHRNPRKRSPPCSMYGHSQHIDVTGQVPVSDDNDPVGSGDPVDNPRIRYDGHSYEDGVVGAAVTFDTDDGAVFAASDGAAVGGDYAGMHRGVADDGNQLTLSFRGQVYVFDAVTPEKVQAVLLLLGGCEVSPATQGSELASQTQRSYMEHNLRGNQPHRAASLDRFRQKRKERNFDKKIRYNVRQEVALRMQRKKGQFTSSKRPEDASRGNAGQDSGSDDGPSETVCAHCRRSSKSTPMMRRGPAGPRTLCNACGLVWANKGTLRDLSRRPSDQVLVPHDQGGSGGSDVFSASEIIGDGKSVALAGDEKPALIAQH